MCKIKNQNNTNLAWNIRPLCPLRLPFRCVKLLQIFQMRKNSNWPISNQNCLHNIAFPKFLIWMKRPLPQASSHTEQYFVNAFLTSFVRWCVYIYRGRQYNVPLKPHLQRQLEKFLKGWHRPPLCSLFWFPLTNLATKLKFDRNYHQSHKEFIF